VVERFRRLRRDGFGRLSGAYEAGKKINGLAEAAQVEGVKIFHAGTSKRDEYSYTSGGRVLGVTARAADLETAVQRAYDACARSASTARTIAKTSPRAP